jgi:hypothetical protein
MAYLTKTENGREIAYKNFTYMWMGTERTTHYGVPTDMYEIGGVVDTTAVETYLDESVEALKGGFEAMDGHFDPLANGITFDGPGA